MMLNNPFLSNTFTSTWLKHFAKNEKTFQFDFIKNVTFLKHKYFPFYFNVGKNITSGMSYTLNNLEENIDYKGRVCLLYDIPEYFNIDPNIGASGIKISKVGQYKGYLLDLESYTDFNDLLMNFKSKKRNKYKSKKVQLEKDFDISYTYFYGDVDKEKFNQSILVFNKLIKKRFGGLGIENNIVGKWHYYEELIYKMVLEKKGVLFATYNKDTPIAFAFCFLSDDILFYAAPTFDTDYLKYNLGHTSIMAILEWCFEQNISLFDFSKGEFEYKKRWANNSYKFGTHILYDSNSIRATTVGVCLINYFKLKQFLRDKGINLLYSKLKYFFKKNNSK